MSTDGGPSEHGGNDAGRHGNSNSFSGRDGDEPTGGERDATERRLRLRALFTDYRGVVALALVAVVLGGGYLAGTAYVAPGTTTDTQVTDSWSRTSSFSHTATVERAIGPFDRDRELSNRSVYFTRATPEIDIRYAAGYTATGDGRLDATVRLRLVRRALTEGTAGDESGGTVLWRTERTIATRNVTGLAPGQTVTVPASVNVTTVAARTDDLVSQLGASPGSVDVAIVADVRVDGRVNGQPVTHSFSREVGLATDGSTYRITGQPDSRTQVGETTTTVVRERSYGPLYRVGGPTLLGAGLVGLVGLVVARRRAGRVTASRAGPAGPSC